jgi:hypothetical protein
MMLQQRRLDIKASEAKLVRLVERVERPADCDRVGGRGPAG